MTLTVRRRRRFFLRTRTRVRVTRRRRRRKRRVGQERSTGFTGTGVSRASSSPISRPHITTAVVGSHRVPEVRSHQVSPSRPPKKRLRLTIIGVGGSRDRVTTIVVPRDIPVDSAEGRSRTLPRSNDISGKGLQIRLI